MRDWPEEGVSFTPALTWSWPARFYRHVRNVIIRKTSMFCWPCIVIYPYNKNQQDAPFTFNVFQSLTCTCFEQAYCSSSGGNTLYIQQLVCFYIHGTVYRNQLLFNNHPDALVIQIYCYKTLLGHLLCPSSGVFYCIFGTGKFHAGFWWPLPSRVRMENLHETYQCRMYSGKLLMMGREDARNTWSFVTE